MYIEEFDMYSCSRCHNIFPFEEMRKDSARPNKIGYDCKYCGREFSKNYNINHKDRIEVYRKKNHDKILNAHRKYNLENAEKFKEYRRKKTIEKKVNVLSHYSNNDMKCKYCGFTDLRALSLDHINGGGNKHRKEIGENIYRWIIKNNYPEGFQVLCMNCQFIKRLSGN
jgi:DNA-directed RNA polymerase subunit RPC12/RpoP